MWDTSGPPVPGGCVLADLGGVESDALEESYTPLITEPSLQPCFPTFITCGTQNTQYTVYVGPRYLETTGKM